ncbi:MULTISPECIES: UDP-N-acetylmuramate dehydrogenase [Methylotenera]|jgi:UDP-N-acetylmuramate dehydrogenase|uniref:UDP-N-acetylenolpyruvoylglucosamine reductase n=1 Tax=Methylotenera mobilis TaxID=359408 RepID=A0A351R867_9PROT|nr:MULTISPECIES: UDP-N-acetylmuramate dehydrogenase [Methylotenera]MDP3210268.1 UDP-N-acetylmuramate dehydrogenase [Methylotenera sp.]MDP3777457.1 UDP-N-acetylmuramate dehydrogenase [Methylotenera sp.]PPC95900.1 MAG: UDP-N-acetylenolpyruvoylglucosamine reductase [Methylotenera sp.]HBA08238.1 UDP-N-acetylmuramate dehydrogenase [Methylotenera mobilis]
MTQHTGKLLLNEPLARYTSWRVGGRADQLYIPADLEDLRHFLQSLDEAEPIYFIGLGSNLLVRDGGVRGTVVLMHNVLTTLQMDGEAVYVEAGVTCAKLAKFCAKEARQGAEFFAGIPGTLGGALAMNAGCYGSETWNVVKRVTTINKRGELNTRDAAEFIPSYRHIDMPVSDEWFVAAWLRLEHGDAQESAQKIKGLLAKRLAAQPLNQPSAGSTFRNPPGDFAARLIEASGLKGYIIGGAQVSEKHANFIVNIGGANALDIELLIQHMRETVLEKQGVALQQEVKVLGELEVRE